ncbi:Vacuolar protein sorting-associated protein 27, partial [Globisporangium splendens]
MNDFAAHKSALELAEASEWSALHRMVSAQPARAEELDDFGMMPLHWACTDTHVPLWVVKILLDTYPLATALKNKGGLVPLHIAVKANAKIEVLRALVAANDAMLSEESPAGETPADLAQVCGTSDDKVTFLVNAEAQLRASGRAPPRPSDRYKSLMNELFAPVETAFSDEFAHENEFGVHGGSSNASTTSMSSAGYLRSTSSMMAAASVPLPPRWRLDKRCNICQMKFSYFKNRHHCRSCGESVCSTHSNRRLPLKHIGLKTPQRVCILCYDDLREHGKPPSAVVNMYASNNQQQKANARKESDAFRPRKGPAAPSVSQHPRKNSSSQQQPSSEQQNRGPVLRPTRSVVSMAAPNFNANTANSSLPSSAALKVSSSFELHRSESSSPFEDAHTDDEKAARPRAWTEMDAVENYVQMQEQMRELQAHMQELQLSKRLLQHELALGDRKIEHAMQAKIIHEKTVAELRGDRMLDINRISLDDDDVDTVVEYNDDDDDLNSPHLGDDAAVDAALTCNYLGMALFEKRDFASAVLELRKSVALNARDPDVWYNLARALHEAGELDDAEIAIQRALDLSGRSYSALSLLGKILHSKGEDDKSIEVFREALGLMDPCDESDSDDDVGSATVGW